jgi:hypothetical protein
MIYALLLIFVFCTSKPKFHMMYLMLLLHCKSLLLSISKLLLFSQVFLAAYDFCYLSL